MTDNTLDKEIDDGVTNLIFSGLSIEQMDKLPKWLLENIEKNKPKLKSLIADREKKMLEFVINRKFGQPNKWTFTIHPIKKLVGKYAGSGMFLNGLWVDPFAGKNSPAKVTNDINPKMPAEYHLDALEFLKQQPDNHFDGALYDPPYSITQAKEVYEKYGADLFDPTNMDYWSKCKDEISRILKPGGIVICFGWNSNGLGKSRNFQMKEILLVPHGGSRNDTIVTVERLRAKEWRGR